jgi:hypothetical protein
MWFRLTKDVYQVSDVHDAIRLMRNTIHACTILGNQQRQVKRTMVPAFQTLDQFIFSICTGKKRLLHSRFSYNSPDDQCTATSTISGKHALCGDDKLFLDGGSNAT